MVDQLTLAGGKAVIQTEEGKKIVAAEADLIRMLSGEMLAPLNGTAFPDGLKYLEWRSPFLLAVHQTPPHRRRMRWIAADSPREYGPGTKYRYLRLSIPYAVTVATFAYKNGKLHITGNNELYFRNEPLKSKTDKLCYPALLNISRVKRGQHERTWICTQYLQRKPGDDWTSQLQSLLEHTWNGGFNRSSEHHEGASWYGLSADVHKSLHPVEKWEKASQKNEGFALGVPWKPAPLTIGQLIDCMFTELGASPASRLAAGGKTGGGLVSRFQNWCQKAKAAKK